MAELVDALDLGSSAPSAWGFNSPLSHHLTILILMYLLGNREVDDDV